MKTQNIKFKNNRGQTLQGVLHFPAKYSKNTNAIIFLHGFPSSHEGFSASHTAAALQKKGHMVLRFDFSHGRFSQGKFEDKLMSKEVQDIKSAIDFLRGNYQFNKLILLGHSTGAINAALYAHQDRRVDKVILSGMIHDLKSGVRYDFTDSQVHDFWTKGFVKYTRPGKWVHNKKIKKAFYDEFFTLNVPKAISKFKKQLLFVHGSEDEIPVSEAKKLFEVANKPKKFVIIKEADHQYSKPIHFRKMIVAVDEFVRK